MLFIEKKGFDLNYKRQLLYRKKRKRKFILLISTISLTLFFFSLLPIITIMSNNKKPTVNFNLAIPKTVEEPRYTICIDPGHGDWDYGAIGVNGTAEKDIVLSVALELGKLLENEGSFNVVYTRVTDSIPWIDSANDSLKERINISKVSKADLFISIHCNYSSDSSDTKGIETWYNPNDEKSLLLSQYLQQSLVDLGYSSNRNVKAYVDGEELAVLEKNTATSSLVELGFLTNISDEHYLSSKSGQANCANALFSAIVEYKNNLNIDKGKE